MSLRYWTADLHLGHANIALYCKRPWLKDSYLGPDGRWACTETKDECALRMNTGLICNMNMRITTEDTVVHVGDFCCRGGERGVLGVKTKAKEWEERLNGKWVFITGNHDDNNTVKHTIDTAVVSLCGVRALVQHRPIERACEVPDFCDFVICGHVHDKWKINWVEGICMVNVGVDANRFIPLTDNEVFERYSAAKRAAAGKA